MRQIYAANRFSTLCNVTLYGFEPRAQIAPQVQMTENPPAAQADCIILPIPYSSDHVFVHAPFSSHAIALSSLSTWIHNGGLVLGGNLSDSYCQQLITNQLVPIDYMKREELQIQNAVPTAEAAIQLAMEELPTTIAGSRILITGYGRIGKVLGRLLQSMGARVIVSARSFESFAWAKIAGHDTVETDCMEPVLPECDLIFNTIPSLIFDEKRLSLLPEHTLLIDLASKPGGVDFESAVKLGKKAVWALSLPGKTAPVRAGEIIGDTIHHILNERRLLDA